MTSINSDINYSSPEAEKRRLIETAAKLIRSNAVTLNDTYTMSDIAEAI